MQEENKNKISFTYLLQIQDRIYKLNNTRRRKIYTDDGKNKIKND